MSEEMKDAIITPEIEFDKGTGKALPIKTTGAPIGSVSPRIAVDKPVPHYLRASNGSCHDLCKFGIKHDSEVQKTQLVFRKHMSGNQKPNEGHDRTDFRTHRQRAKKELSLRTSNKKLGPTYEQKAIKQMDLPPEKIIQLSDSPTNITVASDREPINLNDEMNDKNLPPYQDEESSEGSVSIKCMIPSSILKGNESGEHEPANPSEELFDESVSFNYDGTPLKSTVDIGGNMPLIQEEESSQEMYESSAQKSIGSVEHAMDGQERSSDKTMIERKLSTPEQTSEEFTKTEGGINKSTSSDNKKPAGYLGGARKPTFPRKPKTHVERIGKSAMYNTPVSRAGGLSPEKPQMKRWNTGDKSKREMELKNAQKRSGDIDRPQASNAEQIDELGVSTGTKKKVRETTDAAVKVKTGAELKKKLSMTKADASVKPMVRKKSILSAHRVMGASDKSAASMKLRKVVQKSSTSSGELSGQRNRLKTINITSESNDGGEEKVSKPHLNRVSSLRLKKLKSISPFMTMKNLTKVGRSGPKEKTLHATESTEKVDLNVVKQKLRKRASHSSVRKEEHHGSTSKVNDVNVSTPPTEVIRRNSRDFSSEIKLKHRRTASNQSVERLAKALNFSRGKVVKIQLENATPAWLRFRRNKAVAEKSIANRVVGKTSSGKRVEEGDADSKNSSLEAPAIVLRHADIQDKKEVQGLFNNVIEETASKLVVSRKSKVKALVGAFETVISLQESKAPVSVP